MELQPQCMATFENFYNYVMSDVVEKCTEHFLEDAVDVETLQELKTLWTSKIQGSLKTAKNKHRATRACRAGSSKQPDVVTPPPAMTEEQMQIQDAEQELAEVKQEIKHEWPEVEEEDYEQSQREAYLQEYASFQEHVKQEQAWQQASLASVPVQISIVSETPFLITVHATPEQLQANRIEALLTRDVLADLMYVSTAEAAYRMQVLVDQDLRNMLHEQNMYQPMGEEFYPGIPGNQQGESSNDSGLGVEVSPAPPNLDFDNADNAPVAPAQVDGADDDTYLPGENNTKASGGNSQSETEEDEDVVVEEDDDEDDDDLKDMLGEDDFDSEPDLDSNDDITEDEAEPEETENLILCQYTHVKRNKNLWKFRFENGIMMVDGVEYIFQRATGEGVW